jgi:hypothetical protein
MSQFNGTTPGTFDHSIIDVNDPRVSSYIYAGKAVVTGGHDTLPTESFTMPPVPSYDGGGGPTVANTDALKTFGNNIATLNGFVAKAKSLLELRPTIAAGGFEEGFELDSTYKTSIYFPYYGVLTDLGTGLGDLHDAIFVIAGKYTTTEELNGMTATELNADFDKTENDFTVMMRANGGTSTS